jgi:hypothetical protein
MILVRSFLLSSTWGRTEPFVGQIRGDGVRMRVRQGSTNGLTRLFYGQLTPTTDGCCLKGEFRTLLWIDLLLRFVWLALLIPTALFLVGVARRAWSGQPVDWVELAISFTVVLLAFAFFLGIEIFARRLGDRDERAMRQHLDRLFPDGRAWTG